MTLLLLLLSPLSHAIDPPCYGFSEPNRVEGTHFWAEWEDDVVTREQAVQRIAWAEEARQVYLDQGWQLTDEPMLISIVSATNASGRTETRKCDEEDVPIIFLFSSRTDDGFRVPGRNTTMHELAHAVQYAYMGDHRDSVASWLWWMEGSATALTHEADGDREAMSDRSMDFIEHVQLALHQNVTAFLIPERSRHMYGTAIFVRFLQANYGGNDTLRALWTYGAGHTGDVIWFPDAMAAVGQDFDAVWQHFMAASTVVDLVDGDLLQVPYAQSVRTVGTRTTVEEPWRPQGLGLAYLSFPPHIVSRGRALQLTFEGDPTVDWHVVLVRTSGTAKGSTVYDYVALDVQDGVATGWISGFDTDTHGYLVASPMVDSSASHDFSVQTALIKDEGPMPGRVVLVEHLAATGCGCASTSTESAWFALFLPALLLRRRRFAAARHRADQPRRAAQ